VDNSVDQILHEYRARQHWERREYRAALDYAAAAAGKALTKADVVGYWRMTLLLAECQMELGLMQDFAQSMKELSEHPAVKDDPKMLGRAKALHSRSMGMLGHVGEALVLAKEAAELGDPLNEDGIGAMEMLHSLVAALAESGNLAEAWKYAQEMVDLAGEQDDQQTAGKAYWAVGNVAFLADDPEKGVYYHNLAAENLAPGNDVNTWALFNKGSALARLSAGVVEPETLECIERAELANAVTGGSPFQELEISLARAHWLLLTDETEEAEKMLRFILGHQGMLPEHTLAEVKYVAALALHRLGRNDEALIAASHSEKVFIELGAHRRALEARRVINRIDDARL
jgi:tetratricopeptide (TPR) repeat protein